MPNFSKFKLETLKETGLFTLHTCLLYTSDAADERSSVDLGGRRIIKKKKQENIYRRHISENNGIVNSTM